MINQKKLSMRKICHLCYFVVIWPNQILIILRQCIIITVVKLLLKWWSSFCWN